MLRLTENNKRKYYTLGVSLPKKHWQPKNRRRKWVNLPADVDDLIKSTEAKYAAKIKELAAARKHVSFDTLYEMVEKPVKRDYTVYQWFDFLTDDYKAAGRIGQVRVYNDALRALKTFLNDKDITFDEIDVHFLNRYERHLKRRKVKIATFSIYMRTLRAALNKAIKDGYAKEYPFNEYSIPKGEPNRRAISKEEMEALLNHEKISKDTDNFRIMAFSYYTVGMNFTDIARLTWDNIRGSKIHYTRQKIHHNMVIPIHQKVQEVLNHYKPLTGNNPDISGLNDNYIFPILQKEIHLTEQQQADRIQKKRKQFNEYLQTIGKVAGVEVQLTSYILRHTAITHLVRSGITADAIQALAGHKRLTTTENYIKEASTEQKANAINYL